MSLTDWLFLAGGGWLLEDNTRAKKKAIKNVRHDVIRFVGDTLETVNENNRKSKVNEKRKNTPCRFQDGISYDEFYEIALLAKNKIRRITGVWIDNATIYCEVISQSGKSDWSFSVDFNDWGHLSGCFWTERQNTDSEIPHIYGRIVSGLVQDAFNAKNIARICLSDYVDNNKDLETSRGLNYCPEKKTLRIFRDSRQTITVYNQTTDFIGEHLYPVISILRRYGFQNIRCVPVYDVDGRSYNYIFEVAQVTIDGCTNMMYGQMFYDTSEIAIYYHAIRKIRMPDSDRLLKNKNFLDVKNYFYSIGFTNIVERKIQDLSIGLVRKDGSVEMVLVALNGEHPIQKGMYYDYNTKLIICYHTFRYR